VYVYVEFRDSVSSTFANTADNFLQEVVDTAQRQLRASRGTLPVGEPAVTWRGIDRSLRLVAHKNGRVVVIDRDSIRAATAPALLARAVDDVSNLFLFEWSADSTSDSVRFDIVFVRPTPDSAGHVGKPRPKREAIPVFSVLTPWERPVSVKPGRQSAPPYPYGPKREGYEATIVLRFLVDSTGHAVPSTMLDEWPKDKPRPTGHDLTAYQSFLEQTERAVEKTEFIPAMVGGCPVKQLVREPFVFKFRE
jgi:hypothetical protein